MYSFEGDYKSRPVQSLGGASKKVKYHGDSVLVHTRSDCHVLIVECSEW